MTCSVQEWCTNLNNEYIKKILNVLSITIFKLSQKNAEGWCTPLTPQICQWKCWSWLFNFREIPRNETLYMYYNWAKYDKKVSVNSAHLCTFFSRVLEKIVFLIFYTNSTKFTLHQKLSHSFQKKYFSQKLNQYSQCKLP